MLLACISAFVLPNVGQRVQATLQPLFNPVSYPADRIGRSLRAKMAAQHRRDNGSPDNPRSVAEITIENTQLRVANANLHAQLNRMVEREKSLARLGEVRMLCTAYSVVGGDAVNRDSLLLSGSSFGGLTEKMPVLYWGGVVGRLTNVGVGGARVLLITDIQSKLEATFSRLETKPDGTVDSVLLPGEPVLVEGKGKGIMIANITEKTLKESKVQKNDAVVLNDRDWRVELHGYRIGYVESILPTRNPGFFQVTIKADQNLMELDEVMVMTKDRL